MKLSSCNCILTEGTVKNVHGLWSGTLFLFPARWPWARCTNFLKSVSFLLGKLRTCIIPILQDFFGFILVYVKHQVQCWEPLQCHFIKEASPDQVRSSCYTIDSISPSQYLSKLWLVSYLIVTTDWATNVYQASCEAFYFVQREEALLLIPVLDIDNLRPRAAR